MFNTIINKIDLSVASGNYRVGTGDGSFGTFYDIL